MRDLTQQLAGTNGDGMYPYRFSFTPNGASAPTFVGGKYIKSITRSAAGVFLVTLNATYPTVFQVKGSVRDTGGGGLVGCMGVQYDPTASTLVPTNPNTSGTVLALRTVNNAGANTDYTATTAGSAIDVEVWFGDNPNNAA